jgi:hypothetical protein
VTRALLDVNVLIALLDSDHVDHERVRRWVDAEIVHGWACNNAERLRSNHQPAPIPQPGATVI